MFALLKSTNNTMFISEDIINKIFELEVESDNDSSESLLDLSREQPAIFHYINQEDFELLTEEEFDFLIFLTVIIFKSFRESGVTIKEVSVHDIESTEEANWEILNSATSNKFRNRIDAFYSEYLQEDLLAFVEDALEPDDLPIVTKEGREPLFIILKTIIDVLDKNTIQENSL